MNKANKNPPLFHSVPVIPVPFWLITLGIYLDLNGSQCAFLYIPPRTLAAILRKARHVALRHMAELEF